MVELRMGGLEATESLPLEPITIDLRRRGAGDVCSFTPSCFDIIGLVRVQLPLGDCSPQFRKSDRTSKALRPFMFN